MANEYKLPLCRLIERKSESGRTYFTGYLGDAKVVMFRDEKCAEPRFGGVAEWQLYVAEKPSRRDSSE